MKPYMIINNNNKYFPNLIQHTTRTKGCFGENEEHRWLYQKAQVSVEGNVSTIFSFLFTTQVTNEALQPHTLLSQSLCHPSSTFSGVPMLPIKESQNSSAGCTMLSTRTLKVSSCDHTWPQSDPDYLSSFTFLCPATPLALIICSPVLCIIYQKVHALWKQISLEAPYLD